jgi:hypothetical protein
MAVNLQRGTKTFKKVWPYALLGAVLFALNSGSELPYLARGYLTILELQAGFVVLYFLLRRKDSPPRDEL